MQEELDVLSAKSLVTILANAASITDELSSTGANMLSNVSYGLLRNALRTGIPTASISDMDRVISSIIIVSKNTTGGLGNLEGDNRTAESLLGLYSDVLTGNMVVGEFGASSIQPSFRIMTALLDTSVPSEVHSPITTAEETILDIKPIVAVELGAAYANGTAARRMLLRASSMAEPVDTTLGVSVVQLTSRANVYAPNVVGNPVQLFYDRDPCADGAPCSLTLTMPYSITSSVFLAKEVSGVVESLNMNCTMG
jgi:hypothetical protein